MVDKNERIKIFARLKKRLQKGLPREVIERAVAENEWFSEEDIKYAIEAIEDDMLGNISTLSLRSEIEHPLDIAVIMAGNIPAVGFADLMYVLLSGHRAHIKPSHKDRVIIRYIVGLLSELPIYDYDDTVNYDGVIATGGESANLYFRRRFVGIPSVLRSARSSIAVLRGDETDQQLRGLSSDIFRYSGMGCRSVSLLFVSQHTDMERIVAKIAPVTVHPKYVNNYRYTKAALSAQKVEFTDGSNFVVVNNEGFPDAVSQINYLRYGNINEVEQWIGHHKSELQCIVGIDTNFGRAQHPTPTDYADGVDVIEWLYNLPIRN